MRVFARVPFVLAGGLLLSWISTAMGGGIEVINQGARATGQAEAFAAQADDPSAIYYNPAGLTQLHGTNLSGGGYLLWLNIHKEGPTGSEGLSEPAILPHIYAESDFGLERLRFGIGVNNVFGLQEDWGHTGPLRTVVDKASLALFNIAPTLAFQINDHLSIGAEANIYYGQLGLSRNVVLGAPPTPEGHFRFNGEDEGIGGTAGITWKVDDRNTLAAVYRSGFSMDFHGLARLTNPGPEIGPSHTQVPIDFPQMAELAYAVRPIKPLKLEADVVWTDWSDTFKQIRLASVNPQFNGTTLKENWRDSFSYRFGTQYDLNDNWAVRAGYAYGTSAVPASTFSPLVPDAAYHLFSVGLGYKQDNWSIDAAWQYIYRETRHISNSVNSPYVDGTWENQMYGFMLTFTASF